MLKTMNLWVSGLFDLQPLDSSLVHGEDGEEGPRAECSRSETLDYPGRSLAPDGAGGLF